jgi:DNA mismatch repair protein MSH5
MAHIGSFVPADRAVIPVTDRIFTLFHAEDPMVQPFTSSFGAEMKHIGEAVAKSTQGSMIFIDEFGTGANSDDGAAVCAGVLQGLWERNDNCPMVFLTTHFQRIPVLTAVFMPCSMEVRMSNEEGNYLFMYTLVKGMEAQQPSLGLECALRAGLNPEIVDRARVIAECHESGQPIPLNGACIDLELGERTKRALTAFFEWEPSQSPFELLDTIDRIMAEK